MQDILNDQMRSTEIWVCTSNLRWHHTKGAKENEMVLQQAWYEQGSGRIEWRHIPVSREA